MPACSTCHRDPARVNSDFSECSVADCPHRRHCWSEGVSTHHAPPPVCPWCDRVGWDVCTNYRDTSTCTVFDKRD